MAARFPSVESMALRTHSHRSRRAPEQDAALRRLESLRPSQPAAGWVPAAPRMLAVVRDRVPPQLRAATADPGRRAAAGLAVLVAVALLATAALLWATRPRSTPVPPGRTGLIGHTEQPAPSAPAASPASGEVVVHVVGAVRRPGLVRLPTGARLDEAVAAAGGFTRRAEPASVNLARPLVDGEQIVVARRGSGPAAPAAPAAPAPGAGGGPAPSSGPVDLNTATLEQLDALPGIGPVLAQRILDWRAAKGRFSSVDELGEVSGIGEATLSDLRPLVRV